MIANFIFMIPQAITQSLFAEGSHKEDAFYEHVLKALRITGLILFPTILFIVLFGNFILSVFGKQYSSEAFGLLILLSISGIFISVNSVLGTILKLRNKIKTFIALTTIGALMTLLLSYVFIDLRLLGIGIAWFLGYFLNTILYAFTVLKKPKRMAA